MKKILKYLKRFTFMIIVIVLLVAIQAVLELYLPNLMSDIINNGVSKVEYTIDEKALKNAILTDQIPQLTSLLQENGISKEMILENGDNILSGMKDKMLSAQDSTDIENLDSNTYAMFQDMLSSGIVQAKNVSDMDYIIKIGTKMLIVSFIIVTVTIAASYISARISMNYGKVLRQAIFEKVSTFSQGDINRFGAPSLITRTTNDVTQVQNATVMVLRMMVMVPIMGIGSIFMAISKDKMLSLIFVVVIPILFVILAILMKKAMPLFKSLQIKLDKINKIMREQLSGVKVIRAFDKEEYEKKRFDLASKDHINTAIRVNRMIAVLLPLMTIILNFTTVSIVWIGAKRIDAGAMQIGDLLAFIQYAIHVLFSFVIATVMFVLLPRAIASGDRIGEILEVNPKIKDSEYTKTNNRNEGIVEFKNVSFKYPDSDGEYALEDISFKTHSGKTTAIIGSTGSSKTTVLNLISRFYDTTEGEILVDGMNVKEYKIEDLRNKIGYVPQKAFLFSGTIKDNILYGKEDATEEEIMHALDVAQATEFVDSLEGGLMAHVAQGGNNFSGGQKQRLAIARAIVRKPEIYIFDDSFSALDFKTDSNLRKALKEETNNASFIIVAQRVSTIMDADKIIVFNDGKIEGIGRHEQLLENCEIYKEIVYSQMSKEEAKK